MHQTILSLLCPDPSGAGPAWRAVVGAYNWVVCDLLGGLLEAILHLGG